MMSYEQAGRNLKNSMWQCFIDGLATMWFLMAFFTLSPSTWEKLINAGFFAFEIILFKMQLNIISKNVKLATQNERQT